MSVLWNTFVVSLLIVIFTAPAVAKERGTFKDGSSSGQEAGGCAQAGTGPAYSKTRRTSWGTVSEITSPFGATDMLRLDGYALCGSTGTYVETGLGAGFGFATPTTSSSWWSISSTRSYPFAGWWAHSPTRHRRTTGRGR
jgi:hypothetical protein